MDAPPRPQMTREQFNKLPSKTRRVAKAMARRRKRKDLRERSREMLRLRDEERNEVQS